MLGRSLIYTLRPRNSFLGVGLQSCRAFEFENPRLRKFKNKAAAKERRRIVRASKGDVNKTPLDTGEELPPFLIPPRYKLMFRMMQDARNTGRLQRKEIPVEKRKEFAQKAREYAMYV